MTTLEDILKIMGSRKPFRDYPYEYDDGCKEYFTKSGGKAYGKLIDILYMVGNVTGMDMSDVVEELDEIIHRQC